MKSNQRFEIRVISLKDQYQRRMKMKCLLGDSVSWSFFDAISGDSVSKFSHLYDQKKRIQFLGYDLRPNEIACFISHREVWKQCIESKKIMLVLEDDANLIHNDWKFDEVIPVLNRLCDIETSELFVRIGNGHFSDEKSFFADLGKGFKLTRFCTDPQCALGYILSPQVAEILYNNSEAFYVAVDNYMWRGWQHGCRLLDVFPNIISSPEEDNPSTIGERSKPKLNIYKKLIREYFRAIERFRQKKYERDASKRAISF